MKNRTLRFELGDTGSVVRVFWGESYIGYYKGNGLGDWKVFVPSSLPGYVYENHTERDLQETLQDTIGHLLQFAYALGEKESNTGKY